MSPKLLFSLVQALVLCTTSVFAAESEPNDSRSTANTLTLNSSNSGKIRPAGDQDWWKIATTKDGKLVLTLTSNNSIYIRVYVYDNNGTTQLGTATTNTSYALQVDGLAPGTYYIKVIGYYSTQTGGYTISNSLVSPTQPNDSEPNGSRTSALTLAQNGSAVGHIGYYYNNKRDTSDWYKLTTTNDGVIKLKFTSYDGQYLNCALYDNNGTKLLFYGTTNSTVSIQKDGLAAGTYYIQVKAYYGNGFTTYTLVDSLKTYAYSNDKEPNNSPYQAKTIPANGSVDGHTGFYYNGAYEHPDWWKIYYTGSGNLTLNIRQNLHLLDGAKQYYYITIYRDTLVAPISNKYYLGDATISLTSLTTNHYYYVRIVPYYGYGFFAYRINPVFTQVSCNTLINVIAATVGSNCSNSSITYIASNTQPPYKIQLYRYGVAFRNPVTTNNSYTFTSLPSGLYYARAYADGATGSCYGASATRSIVPKPTGLLVTNITPSKTTVNWTVVSCAKYYSVQYRVSGSATWTSKNTIGNVSNLQLGSLSANTTYEWRVAARDSANGLIASGSYTDITTFKTTAALLTQVTIAKAIMKMTVAQRLQVYPNPAVTTIVIDFKGQKEQSVTLVIRDELGHTVFEKAHMTPAALHAPLDVSRLPGGVYSLTLYQADQRYVSTRFIMQR